MSEDKESKIEDWFKCFKSKEVKEVNIYPNISVFNRKLYTFGDSEEVYLKFKNYDSRIQSQDELAFLDTRSCVFRIDHDRYIVVKCVKGKGLAVLGELNKLYINKNNLNSFDVAVRHAADHSIRPLDEIYQSDSLTLDELSNFALSRLGDQFSVFLEHIRKGTANSV